MKWTMIQFAKPYYPSRPLVNINEWRNKRITELKWKKHTWMNKTTDKEGTKKEVWLKFALISIHTQPDLHQTQKSSRQFGKIHRILALPNGSLARSLIPPKAAQLSITRINSFLHVTINSHSHTKPLQSSQSKSILLEFAD